LGKDDHNYDGNEEASELNHTKIDGKKAILVVVIKSE